MSVSLQNWGINAKSKVKYAFQQLLKQQILISAITSNFGWYEFKGGRPLWALRVPRPDQTLHPKLPACPYSMRSRKAPKIRAFFFLKALYVHSSPYFILLLSPLLLSCLFYSSSCFSSAYFPSFDYFFPFNMFFLLTYHVHFHSTLKITEKSHWKKSMAYEPQLLFCIEHH